jgi:hypothetical protein
MESVNLEGLLGQIRHGNDVARKQARIQCAYAVGDAAVPGLLMLLHDENADVRHAAVNALGMIGNPLAAEGLQAIIRNETDIYTRGQAIVALTHCIGEQAIPDLLALLDNHERGRFSHDKRLCDYAAKCLVELATPETLFAAETWAIAQLKRDDVRDRVFGMILLGKCGTERCLSSLQAELIDHAYVVPLYGHYYGCYRASDITVEVILRLFERDTIQEIIETWAIERIHLGDFLARDYAVNCLLGVGTDRCISSLLSIPSLWDSMSDAVDIIRYRALSKHVLYVIESLHRLKNVTLTSEQQILYERYKVLLNYKEVYA